MDLHTVSQRVAVVVKPLRQGVWLTADATALTALLRRHTIRAGVGARGLPEMHAQLYKLEQEAATKRAAGVPLARPRRPAGPELGKANAGVAARDTLDRLQAPVRTLFSFLAARPEPCMRLHLQKVACWHAGKGTAFQKAPINVV